ncbi:MAG: tRNA pseudouridine(13) synthase TruD [Candidatus Diapherotrites archaeon]|nr:tRNA pseudouridine(13) synthase TruD [Candidatus Diapherotrites archaeon]
MELKTYFISKTPGIEGKIKRKITDFKVREIDLNGKPIELKAFTEQEKIELEKEWPEKPEGKEQLILTMEKFNTDSINAIKIVSRYCRVSGKRIGYAGLKDKRALTSQKISIWKPELENVKKFSSRYIDLRDAEWSNERMELGKLKGNDFEIIVREIPFSINETEKRINECIKEIKNAVPNYFGAQRFGGIRAVTARVGKEFLKGNPKNAVMIYLTDFSEREEEEVKTARKNLAETTDFKQALKEFPEKYRFEKSILNHLVKNPNDFVNAFRQMPKSFCYLFTHAYQSYLFNELINKRIEAGYGLNAIEGDELIDNVPAIPLFGFESKLSKGIAGEMEKELLEKEGIELSQFKVKEIPELSSRGTNKKMVLIPHELKLISVEEDDLNEGKTKAKLSFWLDKGNYATTVLREIMKVDE